MQGGINNIPACIVSMHCTVPPTYYFYFFCYVQLCSAFFLLDQFMHVLISLGALTQPIMSISAQSDSHYIKWCCCTMLSMMSQQTHWPFVSSFLAFYGSVKAVSSFEMHCVCCCTALHCRELPSHLFLKLYVSVAAVRAETWLLNMEVMSLHNAPLQVFC